MLSFDAEQWAVAHSQPRDQEKKKPQHLYSELAC